MELAIVLVVFLVPMLLLGAGLEWLARQEPRGGVIEFLVGHWDDLELRFDGEDGPMANPPVTRPVHGLEGVESISVTFPHGPMAGGVLVGGRARDTGRQRTSGTYLDGHGHEAASLEMFGGLFDGGAGNDTVFEAVAIAADPGSNPFDTQRHAPKGLVSGVTVMRRSPVRGGKPRCASRPSGP